MFVVVVVGEDDGVRGGEGIFPLRWGGDGQLHDGAGMRLELWCSLVEASCCSCNLARSVESLESFVC